MIRINLIPEHVPATTPKVILSEGATIALIVAAASYAPTWYAERLRAEAEILNNETTQKQAAVASLKVEGETIATFKKTLEDLKGRSERIKNLTIGRKQPVYLLDSLQQQHPDRMWLDRVQLDQGRLTITGYSAEPELISEYAARIRGLNDLSTKPDVDPESFIPPFQSYFKSKKDEPIPPEAAKQESILPLAFRDITITKSDLVTIKETDVYQFEIQTSIAMPGAL